MESGITFWKFNYQRCSNIITDFSYQLNEAQLKELEKHEQIQRNLRKQEVLKETPELKFLKFPDNWCINLNKLEDLGNNRFRINIKHHSLDNRICFYDELGEWQLE